MKKSLLFILGISATLFLNAQIWVPDGLRMPGDWNTFTNNNGMGGPFDLTQVTTGTLRWNTTFQYTGTTGIQNFKFASGDANPWANEWRDQAFNVNTLTSVCWSGGTCPSNNNSITVTNGNYYTVNFRDNGYANTDAIFMETSAIPVTLTKVEQTPAGIISPSDSVFVGLKLSGTPSAEEIFYVRYSLDNFATSTLREVTITADSGFTWIPAQVNNATISYYVFSTTINNPTGDIDMQTINLINNSGSNYNYTVFQAPKIFITEIADPSNNASARFVEIFNNEDTLIDFSTGWKIGRYTNANSSPQTPVNLTGTISSKQFYLVSNNGGNFLTTYGIAADQSIGTGGPADSNGDDKIYLISPEGYTIDIYGEPGTTSTGNALFTDGKAERVSTVTAPSSTFVPAEWIATLNQDAPADFNPGSWVGYTPPTKPEPSNHASNFNIIDSSFLNLRLQWQDDAAGTTLPDGYLLIGKTSTGSYPSVADNTALADDLDFSDGNFALNFSQTGATQTYTITNPTVGETYDFTLYSFTNSGTDIDYKIAGAPMVSQEIPVSNIDTLIADDFSDCINTGFIAFDSLGSTDVWVCGGGYFEMNGFGDENDEDWLISPQIILSGLDSALISFSTQERFDGADLELYFSTDYSGSGAPSAANWKKIDIAFNDESTSSVYSNWYNYDFIDIDSLSGTDGYFAFRYNGTSSVAETWRVDDFWVGGKLLSDVVPPSPIAVIVASSTVLKVVFSEPVSTATATNSANYTGVNNLLSAVLNNSGDTVTLTYSVTLPGIDTLIIANIEDLANNVMTSPLSFQFSTLVPPLFQGFESAVNDNLPYTISGGLSLNTDAGASQFPANQRIRTGANSVSISNATGGLESALINVTGVNNGYIQLFLSSTSGTSGNGADASDEFKVFVSLNGNPYPTTPTILIGGNSNARWSYSNDGLTINANRDTAVVASSGQDNPPIYSQLKIDIPNGSQTVQFKIEANNNATSEFWNIDDILVSSAGLDVTPPSVSDVYFVSPTQINVVFDEPVNLTAENTANYTGVPGIQSATRKATLDTVELTFTAIPLGLPDTLIISNIQDTSANAMVSSFSYPFFYNPTTSGLVISEIMYNNAGTDTLEFVEIYNNTASPVALGGLYFEEAFDFTFPSYTLPAGEFAVIALDTAAFKKVFSLTHLFQMDNPSAFGNLTNSTENIVLRNTLNQLVDSVTYEDGSAWDSRADGSGYSLVLCDVNTDNSLGINWSISTNNIDGTTFASPGSANACPNPITVNISVSDLNPCANDSIVVMANASGGSTALKYNWGPNANFSDDTLANTMIFIDDTLEITLVVFDDFSSSFDTIIISPKARPTTLAFDTICSGDSVLLADGSYAFSAGTYVDIFLAANACDSLVIQQITVNQSPVISGFQPSTPVIDGIFDGEATWGSPYAIGDGNVGWAGAEAKNLYIAFDENYVYLGAEVNAQSWQDWGFAINLTTGGDSSEVWSRNIKYLHNQLPDIVIKGNFGNYAELRQWNGSSWQATTLPNSEFAENEAGFVEVRFAKTQLIGFDSANVQFYLTGDNASHGTFDAIPQDQVATSWSDATVLSNYAPTVLLNNSFIGNLCESDNSISIFAQPTGGNWSGTGISATGVFNPAGLGGSSNAITYSYTDANGCSASLTDTITVFATPVANAGGNQTVCTNDLPITLVATGGTNYTWSDGSSNDSLVFNAFSDSLLVVTVTENGCSSLDSVQITVNTSPTVNLGNDVTICDGETAELEILSFGNSVVWSNTATADSILVSPTTTTTYWVEVTTPENCLSSDTISVNVNALPTLTLPINFAACEGSIQNIVATSNGTVTWSLNNTGLNSGNFTLTADTTIYATATSTESCTVSDSIIITANPTPVVSIIGLDTVIYGTIDSLSAVVSNAVGPFSYNWSPGNLLVDSTLANVVTTNLTTVTQFTVNVSDVNTTCNATANYTPFISGGPLQINPTASPTSICLGANASLVTNVAGGTGNYTFSWMPASSLSDSTTSSVIASPTQTTKYFLTVNDGFNTVTDSITLTVNPLPTINLSTSNPTFCGASDGLAVVSGSGSASPYTYSWQGLGSNDTIINLLAGKYFVTVTDNNNCSSLDSITITNPSIQAGNLSVNGTTNLCSGDSALLFIHPIMGANGYQWITDTGVVNNATDTSLWVQAAGNYFLTVSSACGNDTTNNISISLSNIITVNIADTICDGDSSIFNGNTYLVAGTYSDTSQSVSGCDSITVFSLVVNNLPIITFNNSTTPVIDGIFDGVANWNAPLAIADGNAGWAGANAGSLYLAEDASYYYLAASAQIQSWQAWAFLINTQAGGGTTDSWSRDITYNHADAPDFIFRGNYNTTSNYAEFHSWNGLSWDGIGTQASSTIYGIGNDFVEVKISKSNLGNPSMLNIQFFVTGDQNSHGTFDAIPDDEVDTSWTGPTTALMNYATPNNSNIQLIFCANDPIVQLPGSPIGGIWSGNGVVNNQTGAYNPALGSGSDTVVYTFTSGSGCANSGNIFITNNAIKTTNQTFDICSNDSVFVGGAWQNMAGVYFDTLLSNVGCDSIISTTINILPSKTDSSVITICAGDSILIGGIYQSTPGFFTDSFTTWQFCDSLVITQLIVQPTINTTINSTICNGDSLFVGGSWQSIAGTYIDTFSTANGCDSIITTQLNVSAPINISLSTTICSGDSVFLQGSWQTTSGNYVDSLISTNGCDSIVTTQLAVSNVITSNQSVKICSGDSIFIAGEFRFTSGVYSDTISTSTGCDSVTVTQLTVNQPTIDSLTAQVCAGDSIFLGGAFTQTAGWYSDTLISAIGCDSLIITQLEILPNFTDTVEAIICAGDSIMLGGNYQFTAGNYLDVYNAFNGCDSSIITQLIVLPNILTFDTISICFGDSALIGSSFETAPGSFITNYPAFNGCDSIVETHLIVNPLPTVDSVQVTNASICGAADGQINIFATTSTGTLTYSINGGSTFNTNSSFNNLIAAGYPIVIEANGCEVMDTTIFITSPGQTASPTVSADTNYCFGDSIADLTAVGSNINWYSAPGLSSTDSLGSGNSYTPNLQIGLNRFYVTQTVGGCQSQAAIIQITLNANPLVVASTSIATCQSTNFNLVGSGAFSYLWNDSIAGNNILQNIDSLGTFIYTLLGTDANGCIGTDTLTIEVNPNPMVSISSLPNFCDGDSAIILNVGLPAGGSYIGNNVINDSIYNPTIVGTNQLIYTYTDSNNCSANDTALVNVNALPTVSFGNLPSVCLNDNPTSLTQGLPSGGIYSGSIINANGNLDPSLGVVGSSLITYTFTDSLGCSNSADQSIVIKSLPTVSIGTFNNICAQSPPFTLTSGMPLGGVYSGLGVALDSIFNPSTAGQFNITYTVSDTNGCSNSAISQIIVDTLPSVDLGNLTGICQGGNLIISAPTGFTSYVWSTGSTASQIITSTLGSYSVTVTDANGCQGTDQVNLTQTFPLPNVSINPDDTTICAGDFVDLNAGSWNSYQWSNSSTNQTIRVSTSGIYRVTVTNNNGCSNSASTTVSLTREPVLCGTISVSEENMKPFINIYPNPAQSSVNIYLNNIFGDVEIRITDLKGSVFKVMQSNISTSHQFEVDLENLATGVYLVNVINQGHIQTFRLILN